MAVRLDRESIMKVRGVARERGWTFDETAMYLIDLGVRRLEALKRYAGSKNGSTRPKKKGRRIR